MKAYLILENGTVFCGEQFGAEKEETGEIVFSTSMGSYIEALTDPCYYGQILVQTYPLIGNYGMIYSDMESEKIYAKGYVVREICDTPSNFRCEGTLDSFLKEQDIMGICGIDGQMIKAEVKDERLGYVGKITEVNVEPIVDLLEKGYTPVVSTLGCDDDGNVYNINADTAAAYIAGQLQAERFILMTDIAGILHDKDDPNSLIPLIDIKEAMQLFDKEVISGGMIPKVECCVEALNHGVNKVTIMDGRVSHAILLEMLTDEGAGTMVVKEKYEESNNESEGR